MNDLSYMQTDWFATLSAEVARTSRGAVAQRLNVSRTSISLIMSGKYGGAATEIGKRVISQLGVFACEYDGVSITPQVCRGIASANAPTHNPAKLAHWSACQRCPKNQGDKS
jgi:hypothetical protein